MSYHKKLGLNFSIKIANKSSERVKQFKYLGTTPNKPFTAFTKKFRADLTRGMLAITQ